MKKIVGLIILTISCFVFTGCFGGKNDIIADFKKKVEKTKSYYITGELEIMINEDSHKYNIEVSYKRSDKFRVSLKK